MTRKRGRKGRPLSRPMDPGVAGTLAALVLAALAGGGPATPGLGALFRDFPNPARPAPAPEPPAQRFDPKTARGARDLGVADTVED